jgi:DNA-binding transcriptional MerR regulator/methylmalonyl-CoA mutase cobalamin-binding subunit
MNHNISTVERETGLSKDVLRVWERRYGFPKPGRDEHGERQYSGEDVARLRAIKRLMDVGLRPGKLVRSSLDELHALTDARIPPRAEPAALPLEREVLTRLHGHDAPGLRHALSGLLLKEGLQRFALEIAPPLNRAIGDAWMRGDLQVHQEHLYTEQLQAALRAAIAAFPRPTGSPRLLLTTLSGEQHALGLLMLEAVLAPEGAQCISLGTQTPLEDIRRAAAGHGAEIVALSFSAAFPVRQASEGLASLRRHLPPGVALWAGGEMTRRLRARLPGVQLIHDLAAAIAALKSWRARAAESGAASSAA